MNVVPDVFFNQLKIAVDEDRLLLPSLPEVALKIRDVAENEDVTAGEITDILSQDASLSTRLLKVVNSPLYPSSVPIDDLHIAVTRLGIIRVRDLVTNLAIKQMYQPTSVMMEQQFRKTWNTSIEVAAICQMMSVSVNGIRKEQALLAGLIHNIGVLPILLLAENDDYLFNDTKALSALIMELQGRVGAMILKRWNFSENLIEVVAECHNFDFDNKEEAVLVDLVQVALLHGGYVDDDFMPDNLSMVSAFSKLGLESDVDEIHMEENKDMLDSVKHSLCH